MRAPAQEAVPSGAGRVPTVEEAAAKLAEIAARPEFRPPEPSWFDEQLERFAEWRSEMLRRLLEWLGLDGSLAEGVGRWVGYATLALIVAWAIWIAVRLLRDRAADGPAARTAGAADDRREYVDLSRPLLDRAAELARAGDFRRALVALYAGCVRSLDHRGALRFEERKTAREYGRELSGDAREHWRRLVQAFEPAVWGARDDGREAWERARAAADDLGVLR